MKKIIILSSVLILSASMVLAVGPQGNEQQIQNSQDTGQSQQVKVEQQTQNRGEEQNLMIQERTQLEVQKIDEVEQSVQQKKREMNQEIQQMGKSLQSVYQNQNEVRLAVHSLLAMKDTLGGIGPQVSEIATEFNNSVQSTIEAEEKIQTKNRLVKFFTGGDKEAAGKIEQEVNRNQERIQQLTQLKEQCECGDEVKAMFQEQITNMEQEQNRLQQVAQIEKRTKGVFGWLFGWLQK